MKSHSRRSVTGPHTSRPLTELPPQNIHGTTDNDVPAIELAAVNLGNVQDLGIGEMTPELDQKPDKGSSLLHNCIATGVMLNVPKPGSDGPAIADENGAPVVLVRVIHRTGDDVNRDADIGGTEHKSLGVNDKVVSEVRHSMTDRLTIASFAI